MVTTAPRGEHTMALSVGALTRSGKCLVRSAKEGSNFHWLVYRRSVPSRRALDLADVDGVGVAPVGAPSPCRDRCLGGWPRGRLPGLGLWHLRQTARRFIRPVSQPYDAACPHSLPPSASGGSPRLIRARTRVLAVVANAPIASSDLPPKKKPKTAGTPPSAIRKPWRLYSVLSPTLVLSSFRWRLVG